MAKGAVWVILQRLAVRLIGLASTLILVRLLAPADFGIVALATAFSTGLDVMMELGFDFALINERGAARERYDTAWTLSILRGTVIGAALAAAAWPLAQFYGDPRLLQVMVWLGVAFFIAGFQNIGIVDFRKDFRLDKEFSLLVWSKVLSFTVTIALAWIFRDYRALIAGIVAGKLATVALSFAMHPFRPRLRLKDSAGFLHFSKWLLVVNLVNLVNARVDRIILGKIAGTTSVGIFSVAHEISTLATTELIWPIARALFPGYAKIAAEPARLPKSFLDATGMIMLLSAPVTAGIALMADPIVRIALGPEWLLAIPVIQILALYGFLDMPTANVKALFLALGRPDLVAWRDIPSAIVLVPALIVGASMAGAVGAAWALVLSAAVTFVVAFAFLRRSIGVGIGAIARVTWRPFLATLIMAAAVTALDREIPMPEGGVALLLSTVVRSLFGAAVYAAASLGVWVMVGRPAGAESSALAFLAKAFKNACLPRSTSAPRL